MLVNVLLKIPGTQIYFCGAAALVKDLLRVKVSLKSRELKLEEL